MSETEKNPEQQRSQRWQEIMGEIERTADDYGKGKLIDEPIRESIAGLKAFGFETIQSCGGHWDGEEGYKMPYIQLEISEPEGVYQDERLQEEWTKRNMAQREQFAAFLTEFNSNSPKLKIIDQGVFGAFRIVPMDYNNEKVYTEADSEQLKTAQSVMQSFGSFLKEKFLNP